MRKLRGLGGELVEISAKFSFFAFNSPYNLSELVYQPKNYQFYESDLKCPKFCPNLKNSLLVLICPILRLDCNKDLPWFCSSECKCGVRLQKYFKNAPHFLRFAGNCVRSVYSDWPAWLIWRTPHVIACQWWLFALDYLFARGEYWCFACFWHRFSLGCARGLLCCMRAAALNLTAKFSSNSQVKR